MPDVESYRILMQGICRKSQVNKAVGLLEYLLNNLCRKKKLREAYKLLCRMKVKGCNPDIMITLSLDINGITHVYTTATLAAATTNWLPVITFFLAVLLGKSEKLKDRSYWDNNGGRLQRKRAKKKKKKKSKDM
ncbi:hypothetical protein Goarm_018975, partial [Gossypium armourianum]|nr:hypothetical protein [Gossypium armourianum]